MRTHIIFGIGFLLASSQLLAQGEKEINLIADGNKGYQNEAYIEAEVDYRKALSINSANTKACLLYTSPSPRDRTRSRMPSSA